MLHRSVKETRRLLAINRKAETGKLHTSNWQYLDKGATIPALFSQQQHTSTNSPTQKIHRGNEKRRHDTCDEDAGSTCAQLIDCMARNGD